MQEIEIKLISALKIIFRQILNKV